jgi:putative membrane protein
MMMYNDSPGWGGWFALGLMMLALFGLILAITVVAVRSLNQPRENTVQPATNGLPNAQRVLDERFARGEIDAEEYRQTRELIRS